MAIHTAGLWTAHPRDAKPPAGAVLDPSHPLAGQVVACYMMNDGAGGRITDCGPYGFHMAGTSNTAVFTWGGRAGTVGAQTVDGLTTAPAVRTGAAQLAVPRYTYECRILLTATAGNTARGIFGFGSLSNTFNGTGWWASNTSGGQVHFIWGNGLRKAMVLTSALGYALNKWLHLTATYNPTVGGILYLNGLAVASNSTAGVGYQDNTVSFGRATNTNSPPCLSDYHIVYNRVLTPVEIMDRYRRPYAIVALPRSVPRVAGSSPPPPAAANGAALFPACM